MAHVFKPTYTRKVPAGAEKCQRKGKPAVRWKARGGEWRYGVLCADPSRCLVESDCWYVQLEGRKPVKGFPDKGRTEALLASLSLRAQRERAGIVEPGSGERRTLTQLLDAFRDFLIDKGSGEGHANDRRRQVERVIVGIGAAAPADLTPARVMRWIGAKRKITRNNKNPDAGGFGASTAGNIVSACKQFTRWLHVSERHEPTDHLAGLRKESDETDRRHPRRVLTEDEYTRFMAATKDGPGHRGLSGLDRYWLYRVAASTGLRVGELASLTAKSFDLVSTPPTVTVEAAYSKRGRLDVLPLPPSIVADLQDYLRTHKKGRVWSEREHWTGRAAEMVAADLERAGIAYKVDGRYFDFHALRSQYITDLDAAGVSLASMQKLARHSTPVLTSHYTKKGTQELAAEVEKLKR